MDDFIHEFSVQDFTKHKCVNGEARRGTLNVGTTEFFFVKIYPDGNKPVNEGYVSIVFEESYDFDELYPLTRFYATSVNCIVSVVDINGGLRFSQSFRIDWLTSSFESLLPVELERFVSRSALLDSREELLPEDRLTLRCEVVCFYDLQNQRKAEYWRRSHLRAIAREESWFVHDGESDDGYWLLDLRNPDSALCVGLRKQSEFFECLFGMPSKGEEDEYIPIHKSKYDAFFSMLCYVRFGSLHHVESDLEYYNLYEMADRYGMLELQKKCRAHIKGHLTTENAILALKCANACDDDDLRMVAFKLALSNWKEMTNESRLELVYFTLDRPELRDELTFAEITSLEDGAVGLLYALVMNLVSGDSLCYLSARQVFLNRKKLQSSGTWTLFEREMPDLARVISFFDLEDYKSREKYKDHALGFDFYR